ncbi:hypothetical protein B0H14DRAFT_3875854 [Mycena olivaceomarginata]|nr:hypothetical protein B0H14DRAFT_3875854 [Mycena olivaceomarginata]
MKDDKRPRAAKTSAKAKKALQIATAESKEVEEEPKKRRGRPPKAKALSTPAMPADRESDSSEIEETEKGGKETEGGVEIDWNGDRDLTWTLVTAIEEDEDTRRSLFPPPGAPKRNGGFKKKHYHWQLAQKCFKTHPKYQKAFEKAVTSKLQDVWSGKIKNRLGVITDKTKTGIKEMGETGAGIESADDIQPGTALTTKWDELKKESPWFWNMRSLIAEHPNLRPVGIGNNANDMDVSILLPETPSSPADTSVFPDSVANTVFDGDDGEEEGNKPTKLVDDKDSDDEARGKGAGKRRAVGEPVSPQPPTKKTKPKAAISVPATSAPTKPTKPTTTKDRFTATVLAEEETIQRQLAVQKEKNKARKEIELEKIHTIREYKVEKAKVKAEEARIHAKEKLMRLDLARLRMQQDHELRMAQTQQHRQPSYSMRSSSYGAGSSSVGSSDIFSGDDDVFSLSLPSVASSSSEA